MVSFSTRQQPAMGLRWCPPWAGQPWQRPVPWSWSQVVSRWCARCLPLRSTTITTACAVCRKGALTWYLSCRTSGASPWGTLLEKPCRYPMGRPQARGVTRRGGGGSRSAPVPRLGGGALRRVCWGSGARDDWGGERAGLCAPSPPGAGPSATGSCRLPKAQGSRHGALEMGESRARAPEARGAGSGARGPGGREELRSFFSRAAKSA